MKFTGPCATPDTIDHPAHPDGGTWPFLMIHGDQATWADTRTELIGALIEGYDTLPDDPTGYERGFVARYTQAVAVATDAQTSVLLDAGEKGHFDPDALTRTPEGEERIQALFGERTVAYDPTGTALDSHRDETGTPVWDFDVPLVLVATDYAPYTGLPAPTGRVLYVDPSTETSYLDSLQSLNRVILFVGQDAEAVG